MDTNAATAAANPTRYVDLTQVDLPDDARLHDPAELEMLARDIGKNGQLQEIIVNEQDGRYEVVAGVGRVLAARKLGLSQIRAQVRERLSEFQKAAITFSENEHRENTDPVYQAYQLDKMLKVRSCSQKDLAEAVGLPEARVSEYMSIARMPQAVRKNLQRCKLSRAHLVEISRLTTLEAQMSVGQRCEKDGLSLKSLKALIDEILKRPRKPPKEKIESSPDPLADLWTQLMNNPEVAVPWTWYVTYGPEKGPGTFAALGNGWQFHFHSPGLTPKTDLKRWFEGMAKAMGDTRQETARLEKVLAAWAPKDESELKRLSEESKHFRVPQNAGEQAELEALASKGPGAVCGWIYGASSLYARNASRVTWEDMGASDPIQGVRMILDGVKDLAAKNAAGGPTTALSPNDNPDDAVPEEEIQAILNKGRIV